MTPEQIRAAIASDPAIAALVPDTEALAAALSVGRTRLTERLITERRIMATLGIVEGETFLAALEAFGAAPLPEGHPLAAAQPGLKRVLSWLKSPDGLDIGDPLAQQMLGAFAAAGIVAPASAAAVMALARVPDPVSEMDVRRAIFAADGTLLVGA